MNIFLCAIVYLATRTLARTFSLGEILGAVTEQFFEEKRDFRRKKIVFEPRFFGVKDESDQRSNYANR